MSIEIVYDKRFLHTSRGIIPLVLAGASNCTEYVWVNGMRRERGERRWGCFFSDETVEMPGEHLIDYVRKIAAGYPDNHEAFCERSRKGRTVYYSDLVQYYRVGIQHACTLEQYRCANPGLSVKCSVHVHAMRDEDPAPAKSHELKSRIFSTEELERWLDSARVRKAELQAEGYGAYITVRYYDNEPIHGVFFPEGPVAVKYRSGNRIGYVEKYVKDREISFTFDKQKAHVFESAAQAADELGNKFKNLTIVRASTLRQNDGNLAIRVTSGVMEGCLLIIRKGKAIRGTTLRQDATCYHKLSAALSNAAIALQTLRQYEKICNVVVEDLESGEQYTVALPEEV